MFHILLITIIVVRYMIHITTHIKFEKLNLKRFQRFEFEKIKISENVKIDINSNIFQTL